MFNKFLAVKVTEPNRYRLVGVAHDNDKTEWDNPKASYPSQVVVDMDDDMYWMPIITVEMSYNGVMYCAESNRIRIKG